MLGDFFSFLSGIFNPKREVKKELQKDEILNHIENQEEIKQENVITEEKVKEAKSSKIKKESQEIVI